jgi:hypothetical protein
LIFRDALEEPTADLVEERNLVIVLSLYVTKLGLDLKLEPLDIVIDALV